MSENKSNTRSVLQTISSILVLGIIVILVTYYFGFGNKVSDQSNIDVQDSLALVAPMTDNDYVRGNREAGVIFYEYSDFDCPFCAVFHETMKRLITEKGEEVAWVYRHLPLDSLHPEAREKSIITECVGLEVSETAFWELSDYIFEQSNESLEDIWQQAEMLGLLPSQKTKCENERASLASLVQADFDNAIETVGAGEGVGTPWVVVSLPDGRYFPIRGAQSFEVLMSLISPYLTN